MTVPDIDEPVVVGIDAGNTKTDAIAVLRDGTVAGWGRAGVGDIFTPAGEEAATVQVRRAVELSLSGRPLDPEHVHHLALRLAGIDWPEDTEYWHGAIAEGWAYRGSFTLLNDGFASIRLGFPNGCALSITGGTGTAIAARHPDGGEFGLNMWNQHDMGAKGLGIGGYRRVVLAELGIGEPTSLTEGYLRHFGFDDVESLVHLLASRSSLAVKATLARTAPIVTAAALDGDAVAIHVVDEQTELFVSYARAVARRAGYATDGGVPIVLAGTVLSTPGSPLAERLRARLHEELPGSEIRTATLPPACGAALDALAESEVTLTADVVDRLTRTFAEASPRAADAVPAQNP